MSSDSSQIEPRSVLIVEDESIVALDLKLQLQELGYRVVGVAASGEEALELVGRKAPDLVLMDVRLQGAMDGIAAAEVIRREHGLPLIFLTSHSDDDTVQRAARTAPYGYLTKPYQIRELRAGIEVALTKARMERQLREADLWFAHTLQCVSDGVLVTDLDAKIRFLNPAAEDLTGWSSDEAVGRAVTEVVKIQAHAIEHVPRADTAQQVRSVLIDGRPAPMAHAVALVPREGAERVVDQTAGPVNDDSGQRLGAVVVLRDAAQRVAQEARLRASEERFRNAFDFAPLGMALISFSGEFIQVNDALCRLLGEPRDGLMRRRHMELTLEADRDHESQRLHDLERSPNGLVQFEKRYRRLDDGQTLWTLVSVSLLKDGGQPTCHLYQIHDLSEQKKAAEHLAALAEERLRREASELASASKSEFLSRVSHEMRTPLNAVIGFAQLLQLRQEASEDSKTKMYADHIRAAGEHLLALVSDLLDINRAAQGSLKLELRTVKLSGVVDEAMRFLQPDATAHGIRVETDVDTDLLVMADPQRLRQVVLNLGSNAVKYNRQGGTVKLRTERKSAAHVALVIEDQGIGMTSEQLERLFQPFDRLGAERTKIAGTGLGLVIARSMVTEMGGTLSVTSTPRIGTSVTLELRSAG